MSDEKRRQGCLSVGYTGCEKSGHIPGGPMWAVYWLPKGYGLSMQDRLVCAFFDTGNRWDEHNVDRDRLPPLIRVACEAMEAHLRDHPEDLAGHMLYVEEESAAPREEESAG